jgi:predicted RND superfamily exporter protein
MNKWVCSCWNGYRLNFTINPASNNSCDVYIVYTQEIEFPEKREVYVHYSETPIIYNTTLNQTINQTIIEKEKIVPYIPEDVNRTIEELSKSLEEQRNFTVKLTQELKYWKALNSALQFEVNILIAVVIALIVILIIQYYRWRTRR